MCLCLLVAFDLCITLMDEGEISQVVTEARFAYGAVGRLDSTLTKLTEPYRTCASFLLIVGPKCMLAALHAAPW